MLSVVGPNCDTYVLNEADIKVGLKMKYRSLDNLALTDMNLSELHGLSYILFKHATHLNRRQTTFINFFFYRTILLFAIITFYMDCAGLSSFLPYPVYYTMMFTHILTPI